MLGLPSALFDPHDSSHWQVAKEPTCVKQEPIHVKNTMRDLRTNPMSFAATLQLLWSVQLNFYLEVHTFAGFAGNLYRSSEPPLPSPCMAGHQLVVSVSCLCPDIPKLGAFPVIVVEGGAGQIKLELLRSEAEAKQVSLL